MSGSSSPFKRVLRSESGQLAVLIALIFQVLFILFAMVINVGLLIHDKINLQNAVDLGAYYGAERQAEALNEIAHINYQIRQDYKLLTWRYRVLGAFGNLSHPAQTKLGALNDTAYSVPGACASGGSCPPYVCVGHLSWKQMTGVAGSQICDKSVGTQSPVVNDVKFLSGVPGLLDITSELNSLKNSIANSCQQITPLNWYLSSAFVIGFRLSVATRKQMIAKIANDISQADWNDALDGSVRVGILKTIQNNLTAANADARSFSSSGVQIVNGLTLGGCDADEGGLPHWLQDIHIEPHMPYLNLQPLGKGNCSYNLQDFNDTTGVTITAVDPTGFFSRQLAEPTGIAHSSRGVEKNPWCMAYMGVKATTHPRKPFAPLGQAISMTAKAFATPFGGRIGPWDKDSWPAGATQSSGNQVDALAIPRGDSIATAKAAFDSSNPYFPNYSRFPGDTLGLKSTLALGLFRDEFSDLYQQGLLSVANYASVGTVATTGDSLAWDEIANSVPRERTLEAGAVAPDLFDATYYSIDSDYYDDYFTRRTWSLPSVVPTSDEGYRAGAPAAILSSNVANEITRAVAHADVPNYGYYIVPKTDDLLTGWQQGKAVDYDPGSATMLAKFGHCQQTIDPSANLPHVPGNCIAGGRVGYSVRIVHKAYLNSPALKLGGASSGGGPLQNPPGETL